MVYICKNLHNTLSQRVSSSNDPILKNLANTSSDPLLNKSTPLAGSHTLLLFLTGGRIDWTSSGDNGPYDDAGDPREESFDVWRAIEEVVDLKDDVRLRTGPKGAIGG